ncbi:hypothetical protein GF322_04630 [Candidatus Dependentiae bacterium]|nr:hypothetical protein [Candidatus Dependentiae bacterium]
MKIDNNIKNKPYSAAIFIDHITELNPLNCSTLSSSLSEFFCMQCCPIIIFGNHLLLNLIQKIDSLNIRTETSLKYFAAIKNLLSDFDKNWIVIKLTKKYTKYLMIPKKHLQYFFNLDFNNYDKTLYKELEVLCQKQKVVNLKGDICKNVFDVIKSLGFIIDSKFEDYQFINYQDLKKEVISFVGTLNQFGWDVKNTLKQILCVANSDNKWQLFLDGHGACDYVDDFATICTLPVEIFKKIFVDICEKNINWIFLKACFLGGENRKIIENVIPKLVEKNICPHIAIGSSMDSDSYKFYSREIVSKKECDWVRKDNLFLFESILTKFGLYSSCLLNQDFFRGINIRDSIFKTAVIYKKIFSEKEKICISNWPLLLDPHVSYKFLPLQNHNCLYLNFENNKTVCFQTNGQKIVFIDNDAIYSLKIANKIPHLISFNTNNFIHVIKIIDASYFDIDIQIFLKKMFINKYVQIGCLKEFKIEDLILGQKKYCEINVKQFYDKELQSYITTLSWFDISQNKKISCRYVFDSMIKDKSNKDVKREEWILL